MNTSRRGFFGTLIALMVVPKLAFGNESSETIECESVGAPASIGSRLLLAVEIEDHPLRLMKVLGPIMCLSKAGKGVYQIKWNLPKNFALCSVNAEVEGKGSESPFAIIQEPVAGAIDIETRDIYTFSPTSVKRLSVIITLSPT